MASPNSEDFVFSESLGLMEFMTPLFRLNNKSRNWLSAVSHSPFSMNNKARFFFFGGGGGEKIVDYLFCSVVVPGR